MSTLVDLLGPFPEVQVTEACPPQTEAPGIAEARPRKLANFGEAQIRSLVGRVFFPGRPKPPRHILFCAVDETTYVAEICMEVAQTLSAQVTGSVCVVEANVINPELESVFWRKDGPAGKDPIGSLRSFSQSIAGNMWLAPLRLLVGENRESLSAGSLARRLSDFRLEFDYTILHGPPVGQQSEAALLGHLSDGVVVVVEANSTHRIAAQRGRDALHAANAHLLGVVLSERTFPIPERIYRRL